ncbi:SWIM zinc finger family protein [Streptomyces echinatus]|uniref:SWIM zinc finger family protein n=1 Tax=Streptomyces echinatus TaxID=67293 RepID=UPI00379C86ED
MTDTGRPRPGDAARRALRAARERAEAERDATARNATEDTARGTAEGTARGAAEDTARDTARGTTQDTARGTAEGTPADPAEGTAADPAGAPRGSADDGTGRPAGTEPRPGDAARAAHRGASGDDGESGPEDAGAAGAGSGPSVGRRPGDAAREALRAARREASRAEAAEPRRERRASARPGAAAPRASSVPGQETERVKAAQDMRRYLATAFRMPTWADTPDEPEDPAHPTPPPAPPEPAPETPTPSPSARASASPSPDAPGAAPSAPAAASSASASASSPTGPSPGVPGAVLSASVPTPSAPVSVPPETGPSAEAPVPARTSGSSGRAPGSSGQADASAARVAVRSGSGGAQVPATMATPHRDGELRRTFPAFAAREAGGAGEAFAGTWWGNAWVGALEQGALDPKRLGRGRGYADQGHVDAITVTPGLVLAYVRGSRPRPYRVQVRVRTLRDEDWERFLDTAADRPGHIAALLDKELPHSLADGGVPLLPGPGDLAPQCSCPDSGHPCKHAAALCYQTARLLDADPFVLLLLRGRGEKDLLDALSRRSAAHAARAARERQPHDLPGVRATDALTPRQLPPLPTPLPVPPHHGQPPVYPSAPGGPDPFALDQLATDAATRAHALLGTGRDPVGELTLWQDAVRLAAARPGSGLTAATRTLYATLADAVGRTPAALARAVAAWRQGGLTGLAVLEEPWDPPAGRFDRARPLLLAADLPAFRPWRNRLTHPHGHVQLRLGHDGLWYAYESEPGQDDWWPRGTPDLDPVGALTGLGIPDEL